MFKKTKANPKADPKPPQAGTTEVPKAKPEHKAEKAEPKTKRPADSEDPIVLAAFNQGREARAGSISRDDAPHGAGPELDAWRKGYDFQESHVG